MQKLVITAGLHDLDSEIELVVYLYIWVCVVCCVLCYFMLYYEAIEKCAGVVLSQVMKRTGVLKLLTLESN